MTIPYQVAQFVKVELEFSSKFILLSEIQFDSGTFALGRQFRMEINVQFTFLALAKGNSTENRLTMDSVTTGKSLIIPVAFDDFDKTTKFRTEKMAVFTFNEMPPEYVGLTVGKRNFL